MLTGTDASWQQIGGHVVSGVHRHPATGSTRVHRANGPHHLKEGAAMFHRHNRIALVVGIAIAVIAAMAAPASARPSAAAQASTAAGVNVTGSLSWTWQYTPLSNAYFTYTGADKQTGTFRIDLTGEDANGNPTGDSSTYSITDNDNITSTNNQTGCTSGTTGSFSGSGSFPLTPASGTPYLYAAVTPTNPNVDVIIGVPFTETQTETFGGPSAEGCSPGSSTDTVTETATPVCLTSTGGDDGDVGVLQGTYPQGTVSLSCPGTSGTYNTGNSYGSFSIKGTLTVGGQSCQQLVSESVSVALVGTYGHLCEVPTSGRTSERCTSLQRPGL